MEEERLERMAAIKRVLAGVPAADDPEQLARLATMGAGELLMVSAVLRAGEATTVAEAVADLEERRAACDEAERRRAKFRAIGGE